MAMRSDAHTVDVFRMHVAFMGALLALEDHF